MAGVKASNEIITNEWPLSLRVQRGLQLAEEGRFHKKPSWDRGLTILNEDTKKLPLIKRKALAIRSEYVR